MGDRTGELFGDYQLLRRIDAGTFGTVYEAEQRYLKTHVALKILSAKLDPEQYKRFLEEARTIAALDHPHIIRVITFSLHQQEPYLVMFLAAGSLKGHFPPGIPMPLEIVLPFVVQAAEGLQHAHDQHIAHLDIKPANLLLSKQQQVLVADFGIAVTLQTQQSHASIQGFAGTPAYAAPEQFQHKPGLASDQYALGVLVYQWLTGQLPFAGDWWVIGHQKMTMDPPSLRARVPGLEPAVEEVVLRALARDPRARFATIRDFAASLEQAARSAEGVPQAVHTATPSHVKSSQSFVPVEPGSSPGLLLPGPPRMPPTAGSRLDALARVPGVPGTSTPAPVLTAPRRRRVGRAMLLSLLLVVLVGGSSLGVLGATHQGPFAALFAVKTSSTPLPTSTPSMVQVHQRWRFQTGDFVSSSPAVDSGVVYVGSGDDYVYALAASDGHQLWRFQTGDSVYSSPAVDSGVVYVGSGDDYVYALAASDGHQLWRFPTGGPVLSSPAVDSGVVYVGSDDHYVYALAASDGHQRWRFPTGGPVLSSPAVDSGVVYVGSDDHYVYALAASDGHQLWRFPTGDSVYSSPAVDSGVVYVGSDDHYVYALAASDGHQLWRFPTGDSVYSSPAVDSGVVYVGSGDDYVYALAASDGHQLWRFPTGDSVYSSPAVDSGVVYVGSDDHYVYALAASDGR